MCEPISLGIATAASGAIGAIGTHQSTVGGIAASNKAKARAFNQQLKIRKSTDIRNIALRQQNLLGYSGQLNQNEDAAFRAYGAAQGNLNQLFDEAAFANQDQLVNLLQSQSLASSGVATGRSTDRVDSQALAGFQRSQAIQAQNLSNAVSYTDQTLREIRRQKILADQNAWQKVNVQPVETQIPQAPQMQAMPSALAPVTGVLQAGLAGFNTYRQLKAPNPNRESLGPNTPTGYLDWLADGSDPLTQTPTEFNLLSDPSWGEF
ncbi:MAG: hypothetical protein CL779_00715 [Chloroflexi bacterium]|nr:hypothetical protein [Chloroflexota bacterium]